MADRPISERQAWRAVHAHAVRILERKATPAAHREANHIVAIAQVMLDQLAEGIHENRPRRTQHRKYLLREMSFFRIHAGSVVGRVAAGALELARAERYAHDHGWVVTWEPDSDADLSWMSERERAEDHEVWCAVLWAGEPSRSREHLPEQLAQLCGIVDPDGAYRRVVEAELALEATSREQRRRR